MGRITTVLRVLEKFILASCLLIVIIMLCLWVWEDHMTNQLLNDTMVALRDGRKPADILLAYTEEDIKIEPGSSYEIIHQDRHFYWGRWYCIRLDNAAELIIDVYPGLLDSHKITINRVNSCG